MLQVCASDQLGVSCMDLCLTEPEGDVAANPSPNPSAARRLVLVAGKAGGSLMAWRSGPIVTTGAGGGDGTLRALRSALAASPDAMRPQRWLAGGAHGLLSVTGVSVQPWLFAAVAARAGGGRAAAAAAEGGSRWQLVASTGLDGKVLCWRLGDRGLQVRAAELASGLHGHGSSRRQPWRLSRWSVGAADAAARLHPVALGSMHCAVPMPWHRTLRL